MKKNLLPLLLSLALLLTACSGARAASMHLQRTEGTVAVADGRGKTVAVQENLGLYGGYSVDTAAESYAWVNLDSVKLTKLDQNSEILIQQDGKKLEIEVKSGSLFFNVIAPLAEDETLTICSSTMAVGIRGTCGWVRTAPSGDMAVYLLEGSVECTAGEQTALISAGEMALRSEDGTLQVRPFTAQEVPAFVLEELQEDMDIVLPNQDGGSTLVTDANGYTYTLSNSILYTVSPAQMKAVPWTPGLPLGLTQGQDLIYAVPPGTTVTAPEGVEFDGVLWADVSWANGGCLVTDSGGGGSPWNSFQMDSGGTLWQFPCCLSSGKKSNDPNYDANSGGSSVGEFYEDAYIGRLTFYTPADPSAENPFFGAESPQPPAEPEGDLTALPRSLAQDAASYENILIGQSGQRFDPPEALGYINSVLLDVDGDGAEELTAVTAVSPTVLRVDLYDQAGRKVSEATSFFYRSGEYGGNGSTMDIYLFRNSVQNCWCVAFCSYIQLPNILNVLDASLYAIQPSGGLQYLDSWYWDDLMESEFSEELKNELQAAGWPYLETDFLSIQDEAAMETMNLLSRSTVTREGEFTYLHIFSPEELMNLP